MRKLIVLPIVAAAFALLAPAQAADPDPLGSGNGHCSGGNHPVGPATAGTVGQGDVDWYSIEVPSDLPAIQVRVPQTGPPLGATSGVVVTVYEWDQAAGTCEQVDQFVCGATFLTGVCHIEPFGNPYPFVWYEFDEPGHYQLELEERKDFATEPVLYQINKAPADPLA